MSDFGATVLGSIGSWISTFLSGIVTIAPVLPVFAATVTGALYLADSRPVWHAFAYTGAIVGIATFIAALVFGRLGTVSRANRRSYSELVGRRAALDTRIDLLSTQDPSGTVVAACAEASAYRRSLKFEDGKTSLRWVLGSGYLDLWTNLHRAEEALIPAESRDEVLGDAFRDRLRINGSKMGQANELLKALDKSAARLESKDGGVGDKRTVAHVRRSVNEYRDGRWEGIVRARNALNARIVFSGLIAYTLLAIALMEKVGTSEIAAAGVYFMIGATAGLFNRFYLDRNVDRTVDDYGLSSARLFRTLVYSGLAGVGGVVIVSMIPAVVQNLALSESQPDQNLPSLSSVFDINDNPFRLVLAAVFGLSPELLISILRQQGEQLKSEIKSTEPTS